MHSLLKKRTDVKNAISGLGLRKVAEFFVENAMCKIWRLANHNKLLWKGMSIQQKCEAFLSSKFDGCIDDSEATRYPDLYFLCKETNLGLNIFV
jgi:hypothetical protein